MYTFHVHLHFIGMHVLTEQNIALYPVYQWKKITAEPQLAKYFGASLLSAQQWHRQNSAVSHAGKSIAGIALAF